MTGLAANAGMGHRHVVMMSGGIGSWATARRVIDQHGRDAVTLLFADTKVEHRDLYRFLDDASAQLGVPITRVADGRKPWQVFRDKRLIGSSRIAPCSHLLKQKPCREWMEAHTTPDTATVYVGIDWTETHRGPAIDAKWAPWPVRMPLCDPPYADKDALIAEAESVGLRPPELYQLGFPHNNCGGACVRAGQAQWALLHKVDPERFAAEEAEENALRAHLGKNVAILRERPGGVSKPLPLTVLRQRIESKATQGSLAVDPNDWGGCGCFTDTDAPAERAPAPPAGQSDDAAGATTELGRHHAGGSTMTEPTTNPGRGRLWPVGDDGRTKVRVGSQPETIRVLTEAVDARLIPDTYVSDGAPVALERVSGAADPAAGDEDVALPLSPSRLRPPLLAGLLAEHAHVVRPDTDKENNPIEVEVSPPRGVLEAVLARRSWPGLPVLRRIISTPVLRPDGTLLQQPGYDPATGFYLASNVPLDPVPEQPTPGQVQQAKEFLLHRFLADFPWRTAADLPNYLAMLATPLLRPFTRALSPFGVIDATMPGSGKTILTSCVGLLVGQRVLTWTDSDEELRKTITSVLADQVGVVVFDNLVEGHAIESAVLARLVTERMWTDRRLSTNTAPTYPNDRLWLATGNNLRTGGDMASRSVWVRLDPDCPRPEARTGFSIPNLDTWILDPANQATVLRHLLTLILDWTSAGARTSTTVPQMRQFTRWAQHLGGFLEHHGIPGFLTNAEEARDLDEGDAEWRSFFLRWWHLHGDKPMSANDLRVSAEPTFLTSDPWVGSFPTTPGGKLVSNKSLGRLLTGQNGRWRGDIVLRAKKDKKTDVWMYWLERQADEPNPAESNPANPANPANRP